MLPLKENTLQQRLNGKQSSSPLPPGLNIGMRCNRNVGLLALHLWGQRFNIKAGGCGGGSRSGPGDCCQVFSFNRSNACSILGLFLEPLCGVRTNISEPDQDRKGFLLTPPQGRRESAGEFPNGRKGLGELEGYHVSDGWAMWYSGRTQGLLEDPHPPRAPLCNTTEQKVEKQSVNFDLPLSDSVPGKSTVDGLTVALVQCGTVVVLTTQ